MNNLQWKNSITGEFIKYPDRTIFKYDHGGGLWNATALLAAAGCFYTNVEGKKVKVSITIEEIESDCKKSETKSIQKGSSLDYKKYADKYINEEINWLNKKFGNYEDHYALKNVDKSLDLNQLIYLCSVIDKDERVEYSCVHDGEKKIVFIKFK